MKKQTLSVKLWLCRHPFILLLCVLLGSTGLCCGCHYALYEYSPLGFIFYSLTSKLVSERVDQLAPEYQRLNDTVIESLPVYPQATLIPGSRQRRDPGWLYWPPGGPASSPSQSVCFRSDNNLEEVFSFYQNALEGEGWTLTGNYSWSSSVEQYYKDRACVELHSFCLSDLEVYGDKIYGILVYYDLNVFLHFPRVPQFMDWITGVSQVHCP